MDNTAYFEMEETKNGGEEERIVASETKTQIQNGD